MLSIHIRRIASLLVLQCFLLSFIHVRALPLVVRQEGATSVTTVQTLNTVVGVMTETCVITLTPIIDVQGQPAVEEVRSCTITMDPSQNNGSAGGGGSANTSTTDTGTAGTANSTVDTTNGSITSTDSASQATVTTDATNGSVTVTTPTNDPASPPPVANGSQGSITADVSVTTSAPDAGTATTLASDQIPPAIPTVNDQVSEIRLTTIPRDTTASTSVDTPATTSSGTGNPAVTSAAVTQMPVPTEDAAVTGSDTTVTSTTGSAAAAEQPSSTEAAFEVPSKQLSVLPIGLGVFAGISVIALIVVGLVTYERTKYRKAFRQRKLAESGAAVGYGGMAQRT